MKSGLIMEGGAMRGMFTAGVTDVMLENHIAFDGAVGVSAGAVFGCNYKSSQPGRVIRYNLRYCRDPRYVSFGSLLKTGDLYGEDFCYRDLPATLDPFDTATYAASPMAFYVVCTDILTGKAVYHRCDQGKAEDLQWFRASASMPLAAKIVPIDDYLLLDGGIADSIPLRFFEGRGYDHNVVILTQPQGFVKKKNKYLPLLRKVYRKYPKLIETIEQRHERYNETLAYIESKEKSGEILVLRPDLALQIGAIEHRKERLLAVYKEGRSVGATQINKIKAFLNQNHRL